MSNPLAPLGLRSCPLRRRLQVPPWRDLDLRLAEHPAAAGDIHRHDGVDADEDVVADRDVADYFGSRSDEDVVADHRHLLDFPGGGRADGDAVEEEGAAAELGVAADHQA